MVALTPVALVCSALVAMALISAANRMRWLHSPSRRERIRAVLEIVPDGARPLPRFLLHPAGLVGALAHWACDCAVQ